MAERWWRCAACDVKWLSADSECWSCGNPITTPSPPPALDGSGSLYTPISERAWSEVRRQIGVD